MKYVADLILLTGVLSAHSAFAEDEMRWYINEYACADIKITVRSYCRDEGNPGPNSFCGKQTLTARRLDGTSFRRNLLTHEPYKDYFRIAGSLRCGIGASSKPYLYIVLDNGGSCADCEIDGVLSLTDGRWKKYGKRWYAKGKERTDIARREYQWFKQEAFYLENTVVEQEKPTK